MKALSASRSWSLGATGVFGIAQLGTVYHLSERLMGYYPGLSEEWRWLMVGAAVLLVAIEMLTAMSGTGPK